MAGMVSEVCGVGWEGDGGSRPYLKSSRPLNAWKTSIHQPLVSRLRSSTALAYFRPSAGNTHMRPSACCMWLEMGAEWSYG